MKKSMKLHEIQEIESDILREIDKICVENDLKYYLVCGSALGAIRHEGPIPWDYDVDITVPLPELHRFCIIMKENLNKEKYRILIPGDMSDKYNITTFPRICLKKYNPMKVHIDVFPQIGITSNKNDWNFFVSKLTQLKTNYKNKRIAGCIEVNGLKSILKKIYYFIKTCKINADDNLLEFQKLCEKYPYESSEYVTNPCGHYGVKNILPKSVFGTPKRVKYLDMMLPVPEKTDEYLTHYYKDYMKYPPQEEIDRLMAFTVEEEE